MTAPAEAIACAYCDRHRAATPPAGGWVLRNPVVSASMLSGYEYPGWFVLQLNRHTAGYADMTVDEARSVGEASWLLARTTSQVTGIEQIYHYRIGERYPHFHLLIGPPPAQARERGKRLLADIINQQAPFTSPPDARSVAEQVAEQVSESVRQGGRS